MIALQNMRMSCDSTFLLDGRTDCGKKSDEITTLLDEVFEQPGTKVVIFSQWLAMHELLIRRLESRKWGYVFFHGGVESAKRGALIDRFREDPGCRVFLSTDAGGVGLNLQHASVVVNVDLPWNPAVLEQRIGRVHRLGQSRPVQVVNFVAQGTIEEGMLGLLGFKRSLFAGVLDGGEKEVFLRGSRLAGFLQTVEKATAAIPAPSIPEAEGDASDEAQASKHTGHVAQEDELDEIDETGGPAVAAPSTAQAPAVASQPTSEATRESSTENPIARLIGSGLALLEDLGRAAREARDAGTQSQPTNGLFDLGRDEKTGDTYLRVRMPPPEVLERALGAAAELLEGLVTATRRSP
jgi:superfamily II DNA/RNA helicase